MDLRQPEVYTADRIKRWNCDTESYPGGPWVPARPLGHNLYSWLWRWGIALKVLFGIYDALKWEIPNKSVESEMVTVGNTIRASSK